MSNPKPVKEQLVDAINEEFNYALTYEQVQWGTPVLLDAAIIDLSSPTARNSQVDFTVGTEGGPTLTAHIKYNRLSLAEFFQEYSPDFQDDDLTATSAHDLLAVIGTRMGMTLDPADFDDTPITAAAGGGREFTLTAKAGSYIFFGSALLNLLENAPVDTSFHVDLTKARIYDMDQSGDGFLTGGYVATPDTFAVTNTDASINSFFDPYQTGLSVAESFYVQWDYATHYLYNANIYLTGAGKAEYDPNMADVFWVPGSRLYIEQRFRPKAQGANFVQAVNVNHLDGTANPSFVASLSMQAFYQQAQPDDLPGGTVRTNVDILFQGAAGGTVLCTRHYLNGYMAAAYVWCSALNNNASDTRPALENWATMTMTTNGDSQPYEVANMIYDVRDPLDTDYEEIAFDLGNMAANANSGIRTFEINPEDKIVVVTTAAEAAAGGAGDVDVFVNIAAGAPADFFTYARAGENGVLRECLVIRDQTHSVPNGTYNVVVNAYNNSANVRLRIIKIKVLES